MNPTQILKLVDAIHREKNISKDIIFEGIEAAMVTAVRKHYGESEEIEVQIDQSTGQPTILRGGEPLETDEIGRIGAQTAKQVVIQKIREAERDALYNQYAQLKGQLISGVVQRFEGGKAIVSLGGVDSILPRSEQIPGESHHPNERVRATVCDVRKAGSRVQIVLSRSRNEMVQRLFEQEIPEIADGVIEIKSIAREVGYRAKVAVHSVDQRVDCVGACVGMRGSRIKNITDELSGERIDIVQWNESKQEFVRQALKPAEVDEVILCGVLGRAIVLVADDQLSLAIGRRGQNVRLASKLVGWDIEIMTRDELNEQIDQAVTGFSAIEGIDPELSERLVGEGFLTYDDLEVIEPDLLQEMGDLSEEKVAAIIEQAEELAEAGEQQSVEQKRRKREQEQRAALLGGPTETATSASTAVAEMLSGPAESETSEEEAQESEAEQASDSTEEEAEQAEEAVSEEEVAAEEAPEEANVSNQEEQE